MRLFRKSALGLILIGLLSLAVFPKYHPEISWNELKGDKFIVVFPQQYEPEARYALATANKQYNRLKEMWGHDINGKIRILLTDAVDDSNGNATFFPFNQMEIFLFTPMPDTPQGNYRDWIRLVVAHELVHLFNMNSGSGFVRFFRSIAGNNPALYPMIYSPGWVMEGLAVYTESQDLEGGRLNTAYYREMLHSMARQKKMPSLIHLFSEQTDWPGPTAKYLMGGAFFQYLADTYGKEKIGQLVKEYAKYPIPLITSGYSKSIPLTVSRPFRTVFGKDLNTLWPEFIDQLPNREIPLNPHFNRLTQNGFYNVFPRATDADTVYFVNQNYRKYPGIYRLNLKNGKTERCVTKAGVNGMTYSVKHKKVFFSAMDYHKSYYRYSDIFSLDPVGNRVKRLSRGARLYHPTADENTVYCIERKNSRSFLAALDPNTGKHRTLSPPFHGMAYPSLSPDGKTIAVSVQNQGENWQICLFDRSGNPLGFIRHPNHKLYYPTWKNNRQLFFISEPPPAGSGNDDNIPETHGYHLTLFDLESNLGHILTAADIPSILYFEPLPNTQEMVVSFFDANGFNLGRLSLKKLLETMTPHPFHTASMPANNEQSVGRNTKTDDADGPPTKPGSSPVKPYRFLRDLSPKYFTPYGRNSGDEIQAGLYLSGTDLPGEHRYDFECYYGLQSHTLNWSLRYTFDGLFPTITLIYSDFTDLLSLNDGRQYTHRRRIGELVGLLPLFSSNKKQAGLYWNLYSENIYEQLLDKSADGSLQLNGIKLGILFNSAKTYYDSISPTDGFRLALSYGHDLKALGSDFDIRSVAAEYRHYVSIFRPTTLAFRLVFADSWGDTGRLFAMGGSKSNTAFGIAGENLFDLMRGYPAGYYTGTGGVLMNLELRIGLAKLERGALVGVGLQRLYLTVFTDVGNMWLEKITINPAFSLGMELNLIAYLGDIPFNIAAGGALGLRQNSEPRFFFRIGHSF